jgi:hypothetical protein
MRPLVVVTNDQAIRAELANIESDEVFRAPEILDAAEFAVSIGAVLAIGSDMAVGYSGPAPKTAVWTGPPVVVHAGGLIDSIGLNFLGVKDVWELPLELDWLHDRLGLYVAPERTHS